VIVKLTHIQQRFIVDTAKNIVGRLQFRTRGQSAVSTKPKTARSRYGADEAAAASIYHSDAVVA
jgi:hypothetical protein